MRKTTLSYLLLAIFFVAYSTAVLVLPLDRGASFWICGLFVFVSFLLAAAACGVTLRETRGEARFLRLPVLYLGLGHLIVQMLLGALFLVQPAIPVSIVVVVMIAVLALAVGGILCAVAAGGHIARGERRHEAETAPIRRLQTDLNGLIHRVASEPQRAALGRLAEALDYSDPVGSPMLGELEGQLAETAAAMERAVDEGDDELLEVLAGRFEQVLGERNERCRAAK